MSIITAAKDFLNDVVNGIAGILHPEKPREWFANVHLPSDYTAEEVKARLNEAAKANPQFRDWLKSWVDLLKLSHLRHPDGPDAAASAENRERLYDLFGGPKHFGAPYRGSEEQNVWCHRQTFRAIQQRGLPMPESEGAA